MAADAGDLWRVLWLRRRRVLATALLLTACTLAWALATSAPYTATARILFEPRDRQAVAKDADPGAPLPDGGTAWIETHATVIASDAVLGRAIALTGLDREPGFGVPEDGGVTHLLSGLWDTVHGAFSEPVRPADPRGRALDELRQRLAVRRADEGFAIDLAVTTPDPDLSARVADAIAGAYLADRSAARAEAARRAADDPPGHLDGLRLAATAAERKLEAYKASHGPAASSGTHFDGRQLGDSNARLVSARTRTAEAQARLQAIRDARGLAAGSAAIQSPMLERLRSQSADLAAREADLRTSLGERHPFIAAVRTQMQDVRRLIEAEFARIAGAAEAESRRAQADERRLALDRDRLQTLSAAAAHASAEQRALERDAERSRSDYETLLLRAREAPERTAIDGSGARIVTAARAPQDPIRPPRLIVVLAALAGGLGLGSGLALALARERAAPTVLSRRQLERLSGAPVLAAMPTPRRVATQAEAAAARLALDHLSDADGAHPLALIVGSGRADGAERRAAIALLASVAAGRGQRVLLVDADLRAGGGAGDGLLDVLRGERSLAAVTALDPGTGARRLGPGDAARPLRDALLPSNVARFVAGVKGRFELVLIDGGALPDNPRLGPIAVAADCLLLVARAGATRQRDLIDLVEAARALGRPVSGSLLIDGGSA